LLDGFMTTPADRAALPLTLSRREALQGLGALAVACSDGPAASENLAGTDGTTSTTSTVGNVASATTGGSTASSPSASSATASTSSSATVGGSGVTGTTGNGPTNTVSTESSVGGSGGSPDATTTEATATTSNAAGGSGGSAGGDLTAPPFDAVPVCTASPTDGAGQGPFYIHDQEKDDDVSLFRQDIRGQYDSSAEPGIDMELHLRILDATSTACDGAPIPDVEVYIWHTDAQGYYSGFGNPGDQKPDEPYAGVPGQNDLLNSDRFCRGAQVTNAEGIVSFRSIFPGWYNGRDIHIHLVVLKKGSASRGRMTYQGGDHLFTTQFYFEPDFTRSVHEVFEPYKRRTSIDAYEGAVLADEANNSGLRAKASLNGELVVAQMQILLTPT
jgi:protocatechuate 3,4-dioxygenase beta subunit